MEITKVVKPFIRRGSPNTFGNIVYQKKWLTNIIFTQIPSQRANNLTMIYISRVFPVNPFTKPISSNLTDLFHLMRAITICILYLRNIILDSIVLIMLWES